MVVNMLVRPLISIALFLAVVAPQAAWAKDQLMVVRVGPDQKRTRAAAALLGEAVQGDPELALRSDQKGDDRCSRPFEALPLEHPMQLLDTAAEMSAVCGVRLVLFVGLVADLDSGDELLQVSLYDGAAPEHLGSARTYPWFADDPAQMQQMFGAVRGKTFGVGIVAYDAETGAFEALDPVDVVGGGGRLYTWIAFGISGACLLTGAIVGAVGTSDAESARECYAVGCTDVDADALAESGDSMLFASDLLLLGGLTFLVAGVVLFLLEGEPVPHPPTSQEVGWHVGISGVGQGGMLQLLLVWE